MGNFFHLSVSFCAFRVGFAVAFRGQSIVWCNYRWCAISLSHATMTTWRSHVRFVAHFETTRSKFSGALQFRKTSRVRRDGKEKETDGKRSETRKKVPRNSAPYARWHFQATIRAHSRNIRHPFLACLTSLDCSRGEIQIYAPTAPGVFFELMKNESGRAALSPPPLLSPPAFRKPTPGFSPGSSKLF